MFHPAIQKKSVLLMPALLLAVLIFSLSAGTALAATDADGDGPSPGDAVAPMEMTAVTAADSVAGQEAPVVEEAIDAALPPDGADAVDTPPAADSETESVTTAQIVPDAPQAPDYNNDNASELAVLYDYGNANTGLWVFDPNGSGYNAPRGVWSSGAGNWDWNRAKVTTSDYNGDGKSELAVLYDYGNANTGLWLFDPTPTGYAAPRIVWSSGAGNWDWNRSRLTTSDFNADNKTELAVLYDYGNATAGLWLFDPSAGGYNAPRSVWSSGRGNWDASRSKLIASDYNGDGATEMAILYDYDNSTTALWLMDPSGSGYNAPRGAWSSGNGNWSWPRSKLVMSDFNNDGKSEIAVLYNYDNANTGLWLFDPSAGGYNAPRSVWASGRGNWEWTRSKVPQGTNFKPRSWSTGVEWIDVNLSTQTLNAYGRQIMELEERYFIYTVGSVFSTLVSTGGPGHATPTGNFHVYGMNMYTDMSGPGYYAPNVPFVLWFYTDYSIHGTYWHNDFGWPHTHGCVNLPTPAAQWLFYRAHIGMPVNVHY